MLNLRYRAVCRPYSYTSRETTMPPSLRLVQILLPVVLLSVVVNLPRWDQRPISIEKRKVRISLWLFILNIIAQTNPPRFFEVVTATELRNVTIAGNVTESQEFVTYNITDLRMDPKYIRWTRNTDKQHIWLSWLNSEHCHIMDNETIYFHVQSTLDQSFSNSWWPYTIYRYYINWTRLLFTSLLPVIFLVLLNVNIFRGIRWVFYSRFSPITSFDPIKQSMLLCGQPKGRWMKATIGTVVLSALLSHHVLSDTK